jgi:opacity protein-like surface antigen
MKNTSVVLLAVLAVGLAGFAEAAKPKKRTRNANRVGPYAVGFVGQTTYTSDATEDEELAADILLSIGPDAVQNLSVSTEDSDIGYQAAFGFRFNRYLATELSLVQLGETVSTARADMDFGTGLLPSKAELSFMVGGPLVSIVGILPVNDRLEFFARAGYLFSSSKREVQLRVDGDNAGFGSAKGDSQDVVYGAGAAFHFGQVYSLRLEYLQLDDLGDARRSGNEDANMLGLGLVVRF